MTRRALSTLCATAIGLGLASPIAAQSFGDAQGAHIRWLDTLTNRSGDIELSLGQSASNGRLTIQLNACRYPVDSPAAEAQAHLTILDSSRDAPIFSGWMLASSPALSAMDHPRYDVWVIRCEVDGYKPPETIETPLEGVEDPYAEDSAADTETGDAP